MGVEEPTVIRKYYPIFRNVHGLTENLRYLLHHHSCLCIFTGIVGHRMQSYLTAIVFQNNKYK